MIWRVVYPVVITVALLGGFPLYAQEVPAIKVEDLKASPQRFWASFFVFSDTLKDKPSGKQLKLDNRRVSAFQTKALGNVYAEQELLPQFEDMTVGQEYLFVATVGQRKKSFLGFFRRTSFVVIVRDITPFEKTASNVPARIAGINLESATNEFNRTFMALDEIVKEVNKEMFGYASRENISLNEVFGNPEHRGKVAASVRTALRKFEDRNRTSSQEFFIAVIVSIMALQYGYVEPAHPVYEPDAAPPETPIILETKTPEGDDYGTPESWDTSGASPAAEAQGGAPEGEEAIESEPKQFIDWESTDSPVTNKPPRRKK